MSQGHLQIKSFKMVNSIPFWWAFSLGIQQTNSIKPNQLTLMSTYPLEYPFHQLWHICNSSFFINVCLPFFLCYWITPGYFWSWSKLSLSIIQKKIKIKRERERERRFLRNFTSHQTTSLHFRLLAKYISSACCDNCLTHFYKWLVWVCDVIMLQTKTSHLFVWSRNMYKYWY